jgi:hypothetical protein
MALVLSNLTSIVTSLTPALSSLAQEITAIFGSVFPKGKVKETVSLYWLYKFIIVINVINVIIVITYLSSL